MPTSDGVDGQDDGGAAAEVRLAALDAVTDALEWELPAARWQRVDDLVRAIGDALSAQDLTALDAATIELELAGPVRITRVGATSQVPPPPYVRERISRTKSTLEETAAGRTRDADDEDQRRGRDRSPDPR